MSSAELTTLLAGESRLAELRPRPFPLPLGPIAPVVAGGFLGMKKGEWVVAGPRERIGAVLRGCPAERLVDPASGAAPYKLAPVSDAPGTRALHAVGLAMGGDSPVLCFLGLASVASGAFHEALNAAALTSAPVVFLVVAQRIADDAPVARQLAASPAALAEAFGIASTTVTGTLEAVRDAVAAARESAAPTLIQAVLE